MLLYIIPFSDIDECESRTANCDFINGVCINNQGNYTCKCKNGYEPGTSEQKNCSGWLILLLSNQ